MKFFRRSELAFTYRDAYQLWDVMESDLKAAGEALKGDMATVSRDSIDFGVHPSDTPLIRASAGLLEGMTLDKELLLSRRRVNAVFTFAGVSRIAAPPSVRKLLEDHRAHIDRICAEIEHLQHRLRLAMEVIECYGHLKGKPISFNPEIVLTSPETCEVLFSLWERRTAARDAKLDLLSEGLARRLSNCRRWWEIIEGVKGLSEVQLKDLENSFFGREDSGLDEAAVLKLLHKHQKLDVFVGNLDWAAEKYTAGRIKEACAHGWQKLQEQGVGKAFLGPLRQIYRRPSRKSVKDLEQVGKRKPPVMKTIEQLRVVHAVGGVSRRT